MAKDEQEQQQVRMGSAYQSPMYNFGSSIILLTNPEQELYKLELTLRSQILDKDGRAQNMGQPLMNDEGICAVMGTIQTIVNQVTVMSNLDKHEIPALMDFLGDTLAKDLMINSVAYKLNPHNRDRVYFAVLAAAFICMKRAYEEGDKRFWKGSVQEMNIKQEASQQQRGILSRISGWGKNK